MSKEREVLYVTATRIRFMCPMNFNKFPMDTQTCKFQVCANTILWNILIQTNPFQSEQILVTQINYFLKYILLQVGSFNYDNTKMVYRTYYLPLMPNSTESILDYEVQIFFDVFCSDRSSRSANMCLSVHLIVRLFQVCLKLSFFIS